ncbi:hypothetical protein P171DRAFT_431913 [Karstenula rhodostoma CBS 690.94]|uniref:Uncharacterized protein n=1 Tax=Karstenula rhodostoma CBS 690.94 TaxID=1392251 RepID=A0A9P4PJF8_9PLEO|nr:hypothetical protein P171DRAFT_431913 [Karstenula rhodostoma CBS 690.94]
MASPGPRFRIKTRHYDATKWCSENRKSGPKLSDLPVELMNMICDFLVEPDDPDNPFPETEDMSAFRLTSRAINQKTYDSFAKVFFGCCSIDMGWRGLQRLAGISQTPELARNVRHVYLKQQRRKHLETDVSASDYLSEARIRRARLELEKDDFLGRSGADTLALGSAFTRLPNLNQVDIWLSRVDARPPLRDRLGLLEPRTSTHMFAILTAALDHAGIKLRVLEMHNPDSRPTNIEPISIRALNMPRDTMTCFSQLSELSFFLETRDQTVEQLKYWYRFTANFISNSSQLRKLELKFRDNWEDTAKVFSSIAAYVKLPRLEHLSFFYMQCSGKDLQTFLDNHTKLQSLSLDSLRITGETTFADVLGSMQSLQTKLSTFKCRQIAQEGKRLYFRTLGDVKTYRPHPERTITRTSIMWARPHDFEIVASPLKYEGSAEWWHFGGVQHQIGLLKDDLVVSSLSCEPGEDDEDSPEFYLWSYMPQD